MLILVINFVLFSVLNIAKLITIEYIRIANFRNFMV